jgi:hypothetical protein
MSRRDVCDVSGIARGNRRMPTAGENFSENNDPHHEHDFGSVDEAGVRCFFKIDYYDRKTEFGSPDPADPAVTTRVMTIMLAEEY